jgi:uncharacterized membrane protein
MRTILIPAAFAVLAGCAAPQPYAPVREVSYAAVGHDPFWTLSIGEDTIVLSLTDTPDLDWNAIGYPRTLPRTVDGVTTWESGEGTDVISIEARPGPCTGGRGVRFEDRVRVRLSGRELHGCGGRIVSKGQG